ncbi:MAG: sugar phosphate isomerase/epimerase family protein [Halolamina sp.]
MKLGATVGPHIDHVGDLPDRFDYVEVGLGEGERPLSEFDPAALRERATANGLDVAVHLPYRQPLSTPVDRIDEATLSYLDDVLAAAATAGARTAVAHPSARGAGHRTDALVERLASLSALGRDHDVTVCFETTGYAGGIELSRLGSLAEQADVALCLDVGYAYLEAGTEGIRTALSSHGDRVQHLHVHDARRRGDTHIPVGSGDVPLESLGEELASELSEPTVSIEVFTDDMPLLADSAARTERALSDGERV